MGWYQNFFQVGPIPATAIYGEYNLYLIFLSYLIASLASYVALDMSAHLRKPTTPLFRWCWLTGGAFIMGAGIWSMHFVGMLAFIMPMPMAYDFFWTGLSMAVAIVTAALAFLFFTIKKPQVKHYIMSGIVLGIAIPTMHYTGMAGMNDVKIHYSLMPFLLSILIAIVAAVAALWLSVQSDKGTFSRRVQLKLGSALIMGLAICGMHYMGMYSAVFVPQEMVHSAFSLDPTLLAIYIATIVISITLLGLILSTAKYFLASIEQRDKNFLETILENMRGGVIACDMNAKITLINQSAEDIFGAELKTITQDDWLTKYPFFKPGSHKVFKLEEYPLYRALQGETTKDIELIATNREGNPVYLTVDGKPLIGNDNEKLGAVVVLHDITKLKKTEEELEKKVKTRTRELTESNQRLQAEINNHLKTQAALEKEKGIAESASRIKSLFLANMSHELRTPLNAIIGYSELLQEEAEEKEGLQDISEVLKKINVASVHLLKLISDVLDISKIESGKTTLDLDTCSLDALVQEVIHMVEPMFKTKKIEFQCDIEKNLGIMLTDPTRLKQIFYNILNNAYKFTEVGMVKLLVIKQKINEKYWLVFSVIDSGPGIPQDKISLIFSPFMQVTNSLGKVHEGAGLGLAICKQFSQMMGGNITVESSKEKGSVFTVQIPIVSKNYKDKE